MDVTRRETQSGATVLQLAGKLNMVTAPDLRQQVSAAIDSGKTRLVIDLTGVDFMDSSGLGALVNGLKSARQAGGDLRIASPNEQVQLVLRLTNMERLLTAFESAEAAFPDG